MRLFEHTDFDQAIIRAAVHFKPRGWREALIEKDYYVTEALRIIAGADGDIDFDMTTPPNSSLFNLSNTSETMRAMSSLCIRIL